jgi:hypothetical protein
VTLFGIYHFFECNGISLLTLGLTNQILKKTICLAIVIRSAGWKGYGSTDKRYAGITGYNPRESYRRGCLALDVGSSHPG